MKTTTLPIGIVRAAIDTEEGRAARAAGAAEDLKAAAAATAVAEAPGEEVSPWTEDPEGNPILIEGHIYYRNITVNLPNEAGVTFRLANAGMGAGVPVMLHIHPPSSRFAHVFQQSPEGVHPFLGRAERVVMPATPTKEGGVR